MVFFHARSRQLVCVGEPVPESESPEKTKVNYSLGACWAEPI